MGLIINNTQTQYKIEGRLAAHKSSLRRYHSNWVSEDETDYVLPNGQAKSRYLPRFETGCLRVKTTNLHMLATCLLLKRQ